MDLVLSSVEARVLGSLVEKELSTPDYYPLSLNALVNACNQRSNREPVLELEERAVQEALEVLRQRRLVWERSTSGSRVSKHAHRLAQALALSVQEVAVLSVLLLRGPQTPGELRARAGRLCELDGVPQVEAVLAGLMGRAEGALVSRLARRPGSREHRYAHRLCGEPTEEAAEPAGMEAEGLAARVAALEQQVAELQAQVETLRQGLLGAGPSG